MPGNATIEFVLIEAEPNQPALDAPVEQDDINYCPAFLRIFELDGDINYYKIGGRGQGPGPGP